MDNRQPVTCQIRYTLNLDQLSAFEQYARTWISLIERYGGVHHGYFIPRANPDRRGASFPGLGYDGPQDVAIAVFTFPTEESYRLYRDQVAADPSVNQPQHWSEKRAALLATSGFSFSRWTGGRPRKQRSRILRTALASLVSFTPERSARKRGF